MTVGERIYGATVSVFATGVVAFYLHRLFEVRV